MTNQTSSVDEESRRSSAPSAATYRARVMAAAPGSNQMSRTTLNFLLDTLLLIVFTILIAVTVVVRFVFPPGTQADRWVLWGHGYDAWVGLLFNLLALFALGVLVHVMLHWTWVCGVAGSRLTKLKGRPVRIDDAAQTVYGVGLLILLLSSIGTFVAAASLRISSGS